MNVFSALPWMAAASLLASTAFATGLAARIGQNFTASSFGTDSSALPSDTDGAIGPNHFVEWINGQFAVFDKSTGERMQSMDDLSFWESAGVTVGRRVEVTDPRIAYDAESGRWFASMVDVNTFTQRANRFLLAVSATSDPTGAWNAVAFTAVPGSADFADFPTLGIDSAGVYLSGDVFNSFEDAIGPVVFSIPKASLLQIPPSTNGLSSSGVMSYDTRGQILQPAIVTGSTTLYLDGSAPMPILQPAIVTGSTTGPEAILAIGDIGVDFEPHSTLVLTFMTNIGGTLQVGGSSVLNVPSYQIPINPLQPEGIDTLDDGDARISASVRRVGNILYAAHSTEVNNRAAIQWYRVDANLHTLIDSGTITNANLELFYPSIAANEAGTVVIGCNGTSSSTFVGSYALIGTVTNGALSFSEPMLLKAGLAAYDTHDSSGVSRWGDYSATTLDPLNPNHFWTIQSYPASSTRWATQVTELIIPAVEIAGATLDVALSGSNVIVSWDARPGAVLQFSPAVSPAVWTNAGGTSVTTNGRTTQIVPVSGQSGFFQLVQP